LNEFLTFNTNFVSLLENLIVAAGPLEEIAVRGANAKKKTAKTKKDIIQ
jgi:hypothetical protein